MASAGGPSRILLFGGTFDPPHIAHVRLPAMAAARLACDSIVYIPARINPLKADTPPTAAAHRLEMLRLALAEAPDAAISTIELDREGPSYTIDTVRAMAKPGTQLFLLLGADQALEFHRWKQWQAILELATPAVLLRPPWTRGSFADKLAAAYGSDEAALWLSRTLDCDMPLIDVSASEIRRRLREGRSIDGLVPPPVAAYIRAHRLYT